MDKKPLLHRRHAPSGGAGKAAGGLAGKHVPTPTPGTGEDERGGEQSKCKKKVLVLKGQTFSERTSRKALRLLSVSTWMGAAFLVVLMALLISDKLEKRALFITNTIVGSGCLLVLIPCTAWYILCHIHVAGKGQVAERRVWREACMITAVFLAQFVNCVLFLVPNVMMLMARDGMVKAAYPVWCFFIRHTMWNSIYLIFTLRSRFLHPWIDSEGKPVGGKKDSMLLDAPFRKHWYLLFPWLAYQSLLVVALVLRLQEADKSREYILIDGFFNGNCEGGTMEKFAFVATLFGILIYQLIGLIFFHGAYLKLKRVPYSLYRWTNIIFRYHFRYVGIINLIIAVSFIFVGLVPGNQCKKRIAIGFGLLPAQFLVTMQCAINCIVAAPVMGEIYSEEEVDPNRLAWTESSAVGQNETPHQIDHAPKFCFETALKTKFWSWAAYNYDTERKEIKDTKEGPPQAMALAMQTYDLTNHEYIERDTRVLIAWSKQTVVVSFRGTASRENALTDIKAWMKSYSSKQSVCLPGFRSAVHAGFSESWRQLDLDKEVVGKVKNIVDGKKFDKPNAKIIITGHSLGGAMAILAAYDIAAELEEGGIPKERILCYTFGAPRVGNAAFATEYDSQVPNTWQVINDSDVVPALPKFGFLYKHGGRKVFLSPDGDLIINLTIVEFSLRMMPAFFSSYTSAVSDHYLDRYKESLISVLNYKGKGLEGGDESVPEILDKNDGLLSKVYGVRSDELIAG